VALPTISIIIPALNEEETVGQVIEEIPKRLLESKGYSVEIVVVDNNSTDGTKRIAADKGARIIEEPLRGKGRAITSAFKSTDADFIFVMDADYTYPATYLPAMLQLLQECDVVLGSRLRGKMDRGAMTRFNLVGNHLLTFLANVLYGTRISDLCTGYWGFKGAVVKDLHLEARGFDLEANLFAQVAGKHYRILEVPTDYRRRSTPPKLQGLRDGMIIAKTLVRMRLRRGPPETPS
jgi:dolichol-phosphate hexosyltransferase